MSSTVISGHSFPRLKWSKMKQIVKDLITMNQTKKKFPIKLNLAQKCHEVAIPQTILETSDLFLNFFLC